MRMFVDTRFKFPLAVSLALLSNSAALAAQSDIPASFKQLTREQQTACIELDALNRTHNAESLIERLWRLEHRAVMTPNTTSKPVKERINALYLELTPSEEIIQEVSTRMAKPKGRKLPPDLIRDKAGIHEVDAVIDTTHSTTVRRTGSSGLDAEHGRLSDEIGRLESTLNKLERMARGEEPVESDSASAGQMNPRETSGTAGGGPGKKSFPWERDSGQRESGEREAMTAGDLADVPFADLRAVQQLAALEIEHHDKVGTGNAEARLRQLETEIMGGDYVAGGKSVKERLKALNTASPASNLSIKRALKF